MCKSVWIFVEQFIPMLYDSSKISYQSLTTWADNEIELEIKQALPVS